MADDKLEIAVQALRDIVNPVAKWERELAEDERLNGAGVVMLLKEPSTYQRIAEDALRKLRRKVK